jgi:hypothetical protein
MSLTKKSYGVSGIGTFKNGKIQRHTNYNVYALFNKKNGTLKLMNHPIKKIPGFKNDLDGGPVIWPHTISSNDELVTFYEAEAFLEYYNTIKAPSSELTRIARKIKTDDNPVVLIAKLKGDRMCNDERGSRIKMSELTFCQK